MGTFEFVVFGLATWRLSSLLVDERGPWDLFLRFRKLVGIEHDDDGKATIIPDGFFPGVLSCVWCASMWVGMFWTCVSLWDHGYFVAIPFALSAISIFFNKIVA